MESMHHEGRVARTFRFDASRALQVLKIDNAQELTVTFEAASGLVASGKKASSTKTPAPTPEVQFRSGAALTVGSVELQ